MAHVLVIDDDHRVLAREIPVREGHRVAVASDGKDGLRRFGRGSAGGVAPLGGAGDMAPPAL